MHCVEKNKTILSDSFEDRAIFNVIQLSYDVFICENNRKSNKIMHCVENFFF